MADERRASLSDVINYKPEQYLSDDEITLIRNTFKGNDKLMKVLRKVFLPSAMDPELPIEEVGKDAWMINLDFSALLTEEVKPIVLARQDAIKFILGGLIQLKVIANQQEETEQQIAARRAKDSNK